MTLTAPAPPVEDGYEGPFSLDVIEGSAVKTLALKAADEIVARFPSGVLVETTRVAGGESAFYMILKDTEETVAILVWYQWQPGVAWISMAWTHPAHRHQGLYTHLYQAFRAAMKLRGFKSICCGIISGNHESVRAHTQAGMEVKILTLEEEL